MSVNINSVSTSRCGIKNIINVFRNNALTANTCINVLPTVPNKLLVVFNVELYILENIEVSRSGTTLVSKCGSGLYTFGFNTDYINLTVTEYITSLLVKSNLNTVAGTGNIKIALGFISLATNLNGVGVDCCLARVSIRRC